MRHRKLNLPHPFRQSVKLDRVPPTDFLNIGMTLHCEQCSHYDPESRDCTIGYDPTPHRREKNLATYESTGRLAFCRFLEID